MEETLNGNSKDEVRQKLYVEEDGEVVIENGIKAQLDDENLRMGSVVAEVSSEVAVMENGVGNGNEKKGLASSSSSSSSDEEAEVVVTEETDETGLTSSGIYDEQENGVSHLTVEEAVEIESSPVTEELKVLEVIEEHISELVEETADEAKGSVEEKRQVIINDESPTVEAVAVVELANEESDQAESAEEVSSTVVEDREVEYAEQEGTDRTLQYRKEEDSFLAIAKSSNDIDDSHKAQLPETNGNPQIISISARTMQPTSWKGCCGLLDVFRRGDR